MAERSFAREVEDLRLGDGDTCVPDRQRFPVSRQLRVRWPDQVELIRAVRSRRKGRSRPSASRVGMKLVGVRQVHRVVPGLAAGVGSYAWDWLADAGEPALVVGFGSQSRWGRFR